MYAFPKANFADNNTLDEQLTHIKSEFVEAMKAEGMGERDEELMDLWHSIETYFRMRQNQGIDVHAVAAAVVGKNAERGYYSHD